MVRKEPWIVKASKQAGRQKKKKLSAKQVFPLSNSRYVLFSTASRNSIGQRMIVSTALKYGSHLDRRPIVFIEVWNIRIFML